MKKAIIIFGVIIAIGIICCLALTASIKRSISQIENAEINMNNINDGVYSGHSELGPVVVDVNVEVENHKLIKVDLVRHDCGLGHPAEAITEKMVEQNTFDVDAVSGATVSSEIIKNAVNKALRNSN